MGKLYLPLFLSLCLILAFLSSLASAQDADPNKNAAVEIHLDLNRQFYEALRQADSARGRSLSTDASERHLEQIAISARFMVETNLRLLQEQAETNALLRELIKSSKP